MEYTAQFKLVKDAIAFEIRITEPGWWATNVSRTGKVVTWEANIPDRGEYAITTERQYFLDMLETVGYFGSAPTGRKATLNGVIAPASY